MKEWQEDQLRAVNFTDGGSFFTTMSEMAAELGFDLCAFAMRAPLPLSNPRIVIASNYSEAWQHTYQQNNYLAVDPTVQHGLCSQNMLVWSDEVFSQAHDFWEEAHAADLRVGLAQPTRGTHGVVGMLTLARSAEEITDIELNDKKLQLTWLAQIAHASMSQHVIPKLMPTIEVKLTNREISILRWIAEGKSSGDIADILRIAERTVNFHINNAVAKLGVSNRTAAAVQAALFGLL